MSNNSDAEIIVQDCPVVWSGGGRSGLEGTGYTALFEAREREWIGHKCALVDWWVLARSDDAVTTRRSTFGYTARALHGKRSISIDREDSRGGNIWLARFKNNLC